MNRIPSPRHRDPRRRASARARQAPRRAVAGLTLVELMISLMLGLLVLASASAIFISNRQTYRATEGLGRVQENGRMAFEQIARDIREAGGNPCGNADRDAPLKLVNVINSPATRWWTNWNNGIVGYDAAIPTANPANRVANTDAIDLMAADNASAATVVSHVPGSAQFTLNTSDHGYAVSDLAIVCDYRQASLFQVTGVSGANIRHQNTGTPGNCSNGLGYANPPRCTAAGAVYQYGPSAVDTARNATVVRLHAVRWFVGTNGAGGRSLYRSTLVNNSGTLVARDQEIAEGVNDMVLQYLLDGAGAYVDSTAVPANRWADVIAVRVLMDLVSADRAGVGGAQLQRRMAHTVTLRNRME